MHHFKRVQTGRCQQGEAIMNSSDVPLICHSWHVLVASSRIWLTAKIYKYNYLFLCDGMCLLFPVVDLSIMNTHAFRMRKCVCL